jgi:hypothetical protein
MHFQKKFYKTLKWKKNIFRVDYLRDICRCNWRQNRRSMGAPE